MYHVPTSFAPVSVSEVLRDAKLRAIKTWEGVEVSSTRS
jgi:hypothetical protein